MEMNIDTTNLKFLQDFFADLSVVDQRKIIMSAYRKASKPIIAAARANIPHNRRMGLYRSIGTLEQPEEMAMFVGSKTNTQYVNQKGRLSKVWYAHLVEKGSWQSGERHWNKGKSTGVMPSSHFFEKALNQTWPQVHETVAKEWYNSLDKYISKLNKKLK